MALVTTRGVLLRSYDYSETSRILRFLTDDLGVVGVMAKGARSTTSKGGSPLATFAGGELTLYVKETRDLQTLRDFSATHPRAAIARSLHRFAAASVLAEIVLRHAGEAATAELLVDIEEALDRIVEAEESDVFGILLVTGWRIVSGLGFQPLVERCTRCGRALGPEEMGRFDFDSGGVRCEECAGGPDGPGGPRVGPIARRQLSDLLSGREIEVTRIRAHLRLLADFVAYHVTPGRPLVSFTFLSSLIPPEEGGEA